MNNKETLKIERSIDRLVNKICKAKDCGDYHKIASYKAIFVELVHKWEAAKGDTIENNAVMAKIIEDKVIKISEVK